MPAITPLINGINYSWASISCIIFGVPIVAITKIDYTRKQKKDNNYGAGVEPISRGYGNKEYDGEIELYTDEVKRIIASAPNRDILDIPPFDIIVMFQGQGVTTNKDVLLSCEFLEENLKAAQNDTKLLVTLPLIIGKINR